MKNFRYLTPSILSEKHPFVTAKSKKTNRLIQNILYTSSQLSSLAFEYLTPSDSYNYPQIKLLHFLNDIKANVCL